MLTSQGSSPLYRERNPRRDTAPVTCDDTSLLVNSLARVPYGPPAKARVLKDRGFTASAPSILLGGFRPLCRSRDRNERRLQLPLA